MWQGFFWGLNLPSESLGLLANRCSVLVAGHLEEGWRTISCCLPWKDRLLKLTVSEVAIAQETAAHFQRQVQARYVPCPSFDASAGGEPLAPSCSSSWGTAEPCRS